MRSSRTTSPAGTSKSWQQNSKTPHRTRLATRAPSARPVHRVAGIHRRNGFEAPTPLSPRVDVTDSSPSATSPTLMSCEEAADLQVMETRLSLRYPNGRVHEVALDEPLKPGQEFELYGRRW